MRTLLTTALLLTAAAPSAHAATLTVDAGTAHLRDGAAASVLGIDATAKEIRAEQLRGDVPPAAGCRRISKLGSACPRTGVERVMADLGGGHDELGAGPLPLPMEVLAGTGSDTVITNDADDRLIGGPGGDALFGMKGTDVLDGGPGDDVLDGGKGVDSYLPGDGVDTVSYGFTIQRIDVTLDDLANDGFVDDQARSEGELVPADTEIIEGGAGDDYLTAMTGSHQLRGGSGHDRLETGAGDDVLVGNGGHDNLHAGGGDDLVLARDGVPDSIICDDGNDVAVVDADDALMNDCETVLEPPRPAPAAKKPGPKMTLGPRITKLTKTRAIPIDLSCPITARAVCSGATTVYLRPPGRAKELVVARLPFALTPGNGSRGEVELTELGRRFVVGRGPLRLRVVAAARAGGSDERLTTASVTLRMR